MPTPPIEHGLQDDGPPDRLAAVRAVLLLLRDVRDHIDPDVPDELDTADLLLRIGAARAVLKRLRERWEAHEL